MLQFLKNQTANLTALKKAHLNREAIDEPARAPAPQLVDTNEISHKIRELILQKDYPCIGALQAVKKNEYQIGIYSDFGSGSAAPQLRQDLLHFLEEQKKTNSPYLTFWATFPEETDYSEDEFEKKLWQELSHVSSLDDAPWDPQFSEDPRDENFCFSLGGSAFFVVGLHAQSSRRARRFVYPSIVFNLYEQFEIISRLGQYESMVEINRRKDANFQGSVNPMVEKYGDKWEAIQFSGKDNDPKWKCPFHRFMNKWKH